MTTNDIVYFQSRMAVWLRRVVGKWQGIRGIPRLLWWSRRLTFPSAPVLVKSPDNLPFVINREDYGQVMLYYFPYCPELLALISDVVKPGDVCFDLGANVGLLTAHMANCVGENGKVIAVEPNPPVFAQLGRMAGSLFPKQIVPVPAGIAEKNAVGSLYLPEGGFSESVEVIKKSDGGTVLELLSIASVAQRYSGGHAPDFIKLDIEGNEAYLIESMSGLFEQGLRPILLVEFHPQKCEQRGVDVAQIIQKLVDLGYQMRRVERLNENYCLMDVPNESMKRNNILFLMAAHLSANGKLASKWKQHTLPMSPKA